MRVYYFSAFFLIFQQFFHDFSIFIFFILFELSPYSVIFQFCIPTVTVASAVAMCACMLVDVLYFRITPFLLLPHHFYSSITVKSADLNFYFNLNYNHFNISLYKEACQNLI